MHDYPQTTPNMASLTAFSSSGEFAQLKAEIRRVATGYIEVCGQQNASGLVESSDLLAWASVHGNGSSHLPHIHRGALVSGVYYVSCPEGAGKIIFEDPRGALPPFGNRVIHTPRTGQMLLFPPWLVHHVTPTTSTSRPRVSISFNIGGDWSATSDLSLTFPAPS
jgi:hypothetical protein